MIRTLPLLVVLGLPASAQTSWTPLDLGGFGDSNNLLSIATVEYAGDLYVGTFNPGGAELYRYDGSTFSPVAIPGFSNDNEAILSGVVHAGSLVIGTINDNNGAEVWSFDGNGWSQIGSAGLGANSAAPSIDQLAVYGGKLYAGMDNQSVGSQVMEYQSPGNWTQRNVSGFGCGTANAEVYGLTAYAGQLYATTNNDTGCQIWRWDGVNPWERIDLGGVGCGPGGFGSGGQDTGAHALEVLGSPAALWVGTEHSGGAEVWRYDGAWTNLSTGGFGDPDNFIVHDFEEHEGLIYAATENGDSGCEVWAYDPVGMGWTRVDPGAPGDGGFGSGDDNEIAFELARFQSRLIATTLNVADGGEVWELGVGQPYCSPNANSTGSAATISAEGSVVVSDDDVRLFAYDMPSNQFGYFLNSQTQASTFPVPNSQGVLCIGGAIGRYNANVFSTGSSGTGSLQIDLANTPTPTGLVAIQAGETWNFTAWYRDQNPSQTSNFTNGVSVAFE